MRFQDEDGINFGGVSRDFFSGFWEQAYKIMFDGAALLAPISHAETPMNEFTVLGKVLSHGYLCCGFLPCRIAFPVLASVLLGPSVTISQDIYLQSFSDFLSIVDRKVLYDALEAQEFTEHMKTCVINILSRFGCRDVSGPGSLKRNLAEHNFHSQPFAAISIMNTAIPAKHMQFWQATDLPNFYNVYLSWEANSSKVLVKIEQ